MLYWIDWLRRPATLPPQIDAKDAHIWWDWSTKRVLVVPYGERVSGFMYDTGASYADWRRDSTDADRVREMMEMVVERLFEGYEPGMVLREFAKVRQFRQLGAESWIMSRVLGVALGGRPLDPDAFREEFL